MRSKSNLTTSKRVRMTVFGTTSRTSIVSLSEIRQDRLLEEQRVRDAAKDTRQQQAILEEAALQLGDPFDDLDVNGWKDDNGMPVDEPERSDSSDDDEAHPLFSKYFRTAVQCGTATTKRHDARTRAQRNEHIRLAWENQMPALVDQYLSWKYKVDEDVADDAPCLRDHIFHIAAVGVFDYVHTYSVHQRTDEPANVSLVRMGLLGCSPTQPTVAIRLECLELYHQLRRHQSSYGIQAFAKSLCSLHNVTYGQHFRSQLSTAFDIYLEILRTIQKSLQCILGRDGLAWKLNGACPPCAYKQPEEPTLTPARLHSMDGNQSAKRLDGSGSADSRTFHSNYFISVNEVERFKDDVQKKPGEKDKSGRATTCTDNWTAAKATQEDQIHVFDQTGIFILACRHGFVESIAEMKRSGELAKYSLAVVNQLLDVCGQGQAIGHDIGCASKKTIATSSLGKKASDSNLSIVVNAFHGFAHNRVCQLENHPLYQAGFGIEDLETCERIFSSSNATASLIRHASPFHWAQFLDLHFDQWDKDKYFELSRFLLNNYKQALHLIKEFTPLLESFKQGKQLMDDDLETWHREELKYLRRCANEPEQLTFAVKYVEQLEKLKFAEATYASVTSSPFLTYTPAQYTRESGLNTTTQRCTTAVNAEYASAFRKLQLSLDATTRFEQTHDINDRWSPDHPEYKTAQDYIQHRTFIRIIEELEGLVVQRLFELSKANLAATGYKMRKHISKAITRRSTAIRTALDKYNRLAPRQHPPWPKLDYSQVISYTSLGEFAMLKHSRQEILDKPWANPQNREMSMKFFKVKRCHEEIHRLNVEINRLQSWVDHDDNQLKSAVDGLYASSDKMAGAMERLYAERRRVNDVHRAKLQKIYKLPGYSGRRSVLDTAQATSEPDTEDEEDETIQNEALRLGDALDRVVV